MNTDHAALVDAVDSITALLIAAVHKDGLCLSADMRVGAKDAARLLGYAEGHLKNLRQEGKGPVFYQRGMAGSRISYRITDLSAWIESGREVWCDR